MVVGVGLVICGGSDELPDFFFNWGIMEPDILSLFSVSELLKEVSFSLAASFASELSSGGLDACSLDASAFKGFSFKSVTSSYTWTPLSVFSWNMSRVY